MKIYDSHRARPSRPLSEGGGLSETPFKATLTPDAGELVARYGELPRGKADRLAAYFAARAEGRSPYEAARVLDIHTATTVRRYEHFLIDWHNAHGRSA